MAKFPRDAEGHALNKDGSRRKLPGQARSSKDLDLNPVRSEVDKPSKRAKRVHRGAGRALDVPDAVKADIESKDCVSRWVVDESARVQIFQADWWDIYRDAKGKDIRVMAGSGKNGHGVYYVLMIQKKSDYAETVQLKKKKAADTLKAQQVLDGGKAPEYVPDGQDSVIERVAG